MAQPPFLKTRRNNAVQGRRLALHLSLLERHLEVLEAERARAVRLLQKELNHLHVPRRPPPLSPRHLLAAGSAERNVSKDKRKREPALQRSSASKNHALIALPRKLPSVTCDVLPPILSRQESPAKAGGSVTNQSPEDGRQQPDSSLKVESRFSNRLAGSGRRAAGQGGTVYEKSGSGDTSVPDGELFKASVSPRASGSLPPKNQDRTVCQRQGHTQPQLSLDHENKRGLLEGNLSGTRMTETHKIPESLEEVIESKSPHSATMETEHQVYTPSGDPEPRAKGCLQDDAKASHPFSGEVTVEHPTKPSTPPAPSSRSLDVIQDPGQQCHLTGTRSDRCRHFPCTQPSTYHSLGFHPDRSTYPWRHWLLQNSRRPHHRLVHGRPLPAPPGEVRLADDPGHVRSRRRLGKEELVRLDMAHKKHVLALARPPSWSTNYGQPTPYKRLRCAARLKPLW